MIISGIRRTPAFPTSRQPPAIINIYGPTGLRTIPPDSPAWAIAFTPTGRSNSTRCARRRRLRPQIIRAPVLHHLFNFGAIRDAILEHLSREIRKLLVARKAQRDQLPEREFVDLAF